VPRGAVDRRTAGEPDGDGAQQGDVQSGSLDAGALRGADGAVVLAGARCALVLADRRRDLSVLHDAADDHGAERHEVRGGLHRRLWLEDDERGDADSQGAAGASRACVDNADLSRTTPAACLSRTIPAAGCVTAFNNDDDASSTDAAASFTAPSNDNDAPFASASNNDAAACVATAFTPVAAAGRPVGRRVAAPRR
jgi:hypothetical protein